jgi:Aspartyl/Asparaginyl beta-hydroxylase
MNFAHDAQKLGAFDIAELRAVVAGFDDEVWNADASRQKAFDAHTSTQTLKLIADSDFRHTNPTVHPAFTTLEPLLQPFMAHIRGYYLQTLRQRIVAEKNGPGYFIRALLTRLPSKASIKPHIDDGESLKRCHRIHVPIISNPDSLFIVGNKRFHMPEGEMWEINNRRTHAVINDGAEARVHLIMDYVQPGETVFDLEGPLTA